MMMYEVLFFVMCSFIVISIFFGCLWIMLSIGIWVFFFLVLVFVNLVFLGNFEWI